MDRLTKEQRSANMAAIRSTGTKPELHVRKALHAAGFRFRLHSNLPGHPDIVLPRLKTAVFVHGCFWHGHTCAKGRLPRSNVEFWAAKIARNADRDARTSRALKKCGWRIEIIWTCGLEAGLKTLLRKLKRRKRALSARTSS